mmetsp:Transcript_42309/g.94758  ORF Transcript_42309/g.94758 Transcript_42309/m.94758 type:complete len:450 (+) Transcript_42309:67-1416(+)
MQGGAADDLVHLKQVGKACGICNKEPESPSKRQKNELVAPPLDVLRVEDELFISQSVDAALLRARELFAKSVALPIAWLHLDADVESSRARKHERVKEGAEIVCRIQQQFRCKLLDRYFLIWSFCAEEEFYLLALPVLFWCGDYRFARHMTYVVCVGLVWGNLLKDVFRLPRPRNVNSKVWVPANASEIDSTACRDFGFPSTHAMNAVSNSIFTVMYCVANGFDVSGGLLGLLAGIWITSLSFGRLYLGVHSPMDVKAGMLLGLAVAFLAQPLDIFSAFDRFVLHTPYVALILTIWLSSLLVLNPQPRPMTPTFMQNCTLGGLILGCSVGFRMEMERRGSVHAFPSEATSNTLATSVLRVSIGYAILLLARVALKSLFTSLLRAVGLEPNPAKPVPRSEMEDCKQEIKGWELFAAAVLKTSVYASMAWTIVCGAPAVFEMLGIPCEMSG